MLTVWDVLISCCFTEQHWDWMNSDCGIVCVSSVVPLLNVATHRRGTDQVQLLASANRGKANLGMLIPWAINYMIHKVRYRSRTNLCSSARAVMNVYWHQSRSKIAHPAYPSSTCTSMVHPGQVASSSQG